MTATQQCGECGSPLRPCKCNRVKTRKRIKQRSFSTVHDGSGARYGLAFLQVRQLPCWLMTQGYDGPGHPQCGPGSQRWNPTACHLGYWDRDGLIKGCGAAHDLYDGIGGRSTIQFFRTWLKLQGFVLRVIGKRFYTEAMEGMA